jgi:PqqD family protein of HPr-rel-A system
VLDDLSCVVVDPASGEAHALNAVGTAILERCDGTLTVVEIASEIGDLFDVASIDRVTSDVVAFLTDLRERGLIAW